MKLYLIGEFAKEKGNTVRNWGKASKAKKIIKGLNVCEIKEGTTETYKRTGRKVVSICGCS